MAHITWLCEHDWDAIAYDINSAMRQAAIDAVVADGHTVGELDKKTLVCPAIDV